MLRSSLRNARVGALLPDRVTFWVTSKHPRNGSRFAAFAVMLSLWVAMCALEVSPDLHRLLHKDAQAPGHNCLVTQFQQHLLLSGFVANVAPARPDVPSSPLNVGDFQLHTSFDYRLTPSRAPPTV